MKKILALALALLSGPALAQSTVFPTMDATGTTRNVYLNQNAFPGYNIGSVDTGTGRFTPSGPDQLFLGGIGAPSNALGLNNNWYQDTYSGTIYGPKAGGVWPAPSVSPCQWNYSMINGVATATYCGNVASSSGTLTIAGPTSGITGMFNATQTFTGAMNNFFPNAYTCNYGILSATSTANSYWCLSIAANANGVGSIGTPGGLSVQTTLNQVSADPHGGFYVALGTLANAVTNDGGTQTTLSANALSGATSLTVTSISGFSNGDYIQVKLTNGLWQSTVISGAPSGTTLTIAPGLYGAAASGNVVAVPKGTLQGAILQAQAGAAATNLNAVVGASVTAYSVTGSSFFLRRQLSVENDYKGDVVAFGFDEMIGISAQVGVTGLATYGITAGDETGPFPIASTGTFIKVGGIVASATGNQAVYSLANALDFSTTSITGNFAVWTNSSVTYSLTGAGVANLSQAKLSHAYPELDFNDLHATVTTGGLQRFGGDGSGNYYWTINTAVAGDFSTGTNVFEVLANGKFNILQGIQIGGVGGVTCSGSPTASFASTGGIVTHC